MKAKKWFINSFNDLNYILVKRSTNHLANSAEWRKKYVIRLNTYGQSCSVPMYLCSLEVVIYSFYFWSNANSNKIYICTSKFFENLFTYFFYLYTCFRLELIWLLQFHANPKPKFKMTNFKIFIFISILLHT